MFMSKKFLTSLSLFTSSTLLFASTPTDTTSLNNDIISANTGADTTLNFQNNITLALTPALPLLRPLNTLPNFTPVVQTMTINGGNFILSGANSFRGFFALGGTVAINNLTFSNFKATGGSGSFAFLGGGGGGGAGLGGALYVSNGATVTLTNPSFIGCNATGGMGGSFSTSGGGFGAGGGGGLTGNGGGIQGQDGGAGGGGFAFNGGSSAPGGGGGGATNSAGGDGVLTFGTGGDGGSNWTPGPPGAGGAGGGSGVNGSAGPTTGTGGGGGGSAVTTGGSGGNGNTGGGGGGGASAETNGGSGGNGNKYGGGGGGGQGNNAGSGGLSLFGGGGGGGGACTSPGGGTGAGGVGGFGGGGGGGGDGVNSGNFGKGASGGFGGGSGANGFGDPVNGTGGVGGGGAGFGGAIFIENGGNLTIQGRALFQGNSVTGGSAGGTGATNGRAAGVDIFMMSGGSLTFSITSNVSIPNPIEGNQGNGGGSITAGGLTKEGCATLTLQGANTFTGTTVVNAGTLQINGSILTDVQNNATLTGNFTTSGSITNTGVLIPGINGVGQINILGNFVNQPAGFVVVDITPQAVVPDTFLNVSGTTTLTGGTLEVILNPGNYIQGTQYVVIRGATTGAFTNFIETGVIGVTVVPSVTPTGVILTVLNSQIFNHQTIAPGVPSAVASCIVSGNIVPGSDFGTVVVLLGQLSDSSLNNALYELSPVNYGALDLINARNNSYITDILSNRLYQLDRSPEQCDCWAISPWVDFYGTQINNKWHFDNLTAFEANTTGVLTGLDLAYKKCFLFGAALGYDHTWLHWKKNLGNGRGNSYMIALYSIYRGCCFNIDFSALGGGSTYDLKRKIKFQETSLQTIIQPNLCGGDPTVIQANRQVSVDRSAKSDPWGYFAIAHLGLSGYWEWCNKTIEPFALVDYHYYHRKSFNEHGADSLNLNVKAHSDNFLRSEAGLNLLRTWASDCFCITPYMGVSWVGEFPLGKSSQKARFAGQSCVFEVTSFHSSLQFISPQIGITWTRDCGLSLSMNYKGLFNKKVKINEADVQLEWIF